MVAVKLVEAAGDRVPGDKLFLTRQRLGRAPPHDFKPFLGRRGPRRFDPANDVFAADEGLAPSLTADLGIVHLGVPGRRSIGRRQAG